VQPLRPSAGRLQEVQALSHLPARARAPGRNSRHDEEFVVMKNRITTNSSDAYCPAFGGDGFMVIENRIATNSSDAYCPDFGGDGFLASQADIR
jgi:hypothetical protein